MTIYWMLIVAGLLSGASKLLDKYLDKQSDPTLRLKEALSMSDEAYAHLDRLTARRIKLIFLSAGLSLAAGAFALAFMVALTLKLINE